MKRWIAIAAVVVGLAALLYALFARPSDEERIRAQLDRLAHAVSIDPGEQNPLLRGARLKRGFSEIFSDLVDVEIPELASSSEPRDALALLAASAGSDFQSADVGFSKIEIAIDGHRTHAEVRAVVTLTGSRGGEIERDERRARFGFLRKDVWRIESVSVETRPGAP